MTEQVKYLLVGAGLAAHHAARGIRERDQDGRIVMVGDEPEFPYTRPHLSKAYLMGKRERAKVYVKPAEFYSNEVKAEVWTSRRVTAIDAQQNTAWLGDHTSIHFDYALLATGGEPRRLTIPGAELPGVFYLRTLADADAIRRALEKARRAVVIGGGFIGAEVASSLTQQGIATTLILHDDVLLKRQVGPAAGQFLTQYFTDKGVSLLKHATLKDITRNGGTLEVNLVDDVRLQADFVVVGVGITPRTNLAQAAGLKVENGVIVNAYLGTSTPAIYAAGDIAHYHDARYDHTLRLEHWDNAIAMGKVAGLNMAGAKQPFDHIPYFYSDLFDLDLQAWGDLYRWEAVIVRGSLGQQLTYFYLYHNRLVAGMAVNPSKEDAAGLQSLVTAMPEVQDAKPYSDVHVPYEELK